MLNKRILSLVLIFLLAILLLNSHVFAEEVKKVAILPFQVHSKTNATQIQESLFEALSDQLRQMRNIQLIDKRVVFGVTEGKNIDDALVIRTGKQTGAAFVITGIVTELGEIISVDVRILDVARNVYLPVIFTQGRGAEGIGQIAMRLIGDILVRVGAEQRIVRIEFKGNRRIESSAINQILISATGSVFSDSNLAQDIKAIYKMGYFTDVTAQISEVPEGKVITYVVRPPC